MSELDETSTKKGNGPFIAIILVLLVALAAMAVMWSKKKSELSDCTTENTNLLADRAAMDEMMSGYVDNMSHDLKSDFKNMLSTYDALIEKDASKSDSLNAQKAKIQGLLDELETAQKNGKVKASLIAKLKRENETLRSIMKSYVKQIDSLNTLNLKLTSDLDQKTTELNSTISERDNFKQVAEESAAQVKKGSKLQAYNFSSGGLRMKLNNTTEATTKAKNVVQFKSSFTIGENPITSAGAKTVYLQIINPDGKTLQSKSSNTVQTEAGAVAYSDKKEIDYQNKSVDVAIYYDLKGEDAIKGNYKVKIYCDGNLIGSDSFTLK